MEETLLVNGDAEESSEPPDPKPRRDATKVLLGLVIMMLIGVLVLQFIQLRRSTDLTSEVAALTEDVTDLKPLRRDVDIIGDQMASLDDQIAAAVEAAGASPVAISGPTETDTAALQVDTGNLPIFENSGNDPAVLSQMTLATITGPEYYSGAEATYAPEDGKARVWLIWAHWCPYCQAELPEVETWWPENASRFPNVELVTVTSAIDGSRSNPLTPYLDTEQFSFPVIVDDTGAISQRFGTAAFPFWVVTDADGTVVLRVAGAIGIASVDQIFAQLETITSEA